MLDRLLCLWPPYRRKQDEALEAAIRYLVENPSEPCIFSGAYIAGVTRSDL